MKAGWFKLSLVVLYSSFALELRAITPEQVQHLPPPANRQINFTQEIKPVLDASCIKCHGRGRTKGNFKLDNRETFLKGGSTGPAVIVGKSEDSYLIELVMGFDPDNVMPQKGSRLTREQISLLRAWIDQGLAWDASVSFAKPEPANFKSRRPETPDARKGNVNPIDQFVRRYFDEHKIKPPPLVVDRVFARRVYLDIIGLLPPPAELGRFVADRRADKRERLVQRLLADERNYAEHWLTFWNDMLRNDYKGTGYIDGGRKQITKWLYSALRTNMPYDQFVTQLINPTPECEGFSKGFVWRGVVNASQTPPMQAAQNISQVFMGINLKCASCHDSFVSDWQLSEAYALANIYSDEPLEIFQCDKPTGKKAGMRFLYPELGEVDVSAAKTNRLKQLAACIISPQNGRLSRTFVNRLWGRLMGRALVEPVDDMEQRAWNPDLLDWLAEDFVAHKYDVKHLITQIVTSRAYQLPGVNLGEQNQKDFVFRGPSVRRMTAEEFRDALTTLTGIGYSSPDASDVELGEAAAKKYALPITPKWIWSNKNGSDKAPPGYAYFRKTIELSALPTDATALVTADNVYTLFVNGQKVGSGSEFKEANRYDLRPLLKKGENVFAAEVINNYSDNTPPDPNKTGGENPAGLLFYARLRHVENGVEKTNDFISDRSWLFSSEKKDSWEKTDFSDANWSDSVELGEMMMLPWRVAKNYMATTLASGYPGNVRASLVASDPLMTALGRPNRDQVVTTRASAATTLQALEMTNGKTLSDILKRGAHNLARDAKSNRALIQKIYAEGLGRKPTANEIKMAEELIGKPVKKEGVEDFLWAMTMLPEFQLIY